MTGRGANAGGVERGSPDARPVILVVAKSPRPGRVKTRLGAVIGAAASCEFARAFVEATLLSAASARLGRVVIFGDVAELGRFDSRVPEGVEYWAQGVGTLGDRLRRGFLRAEREGAPFTIAIGADTPHLTSEHWTLAARALERHSCVLGPSEDGGFYLLGLAHGAAAEYDAVFGGDDWGSERVLERVRRAISALSQSSAELGTFWDIDTYDDLIQYLTEVQNLDPELLPGARAALSESAAASRADLGEDRTHPSARREAAPPLDPAVESGAESRVDSRSSDAWFSLARRLRQSLGR